MSSSSKEGGGNSIPQWDHELGVWIGDKAPGIDPKDFPSPLYIFGYGSLIWKPGPFLERYESALAIALGYKRLFAQRSYDHRGNQYFPGIVLNLVDDQSLSLNGYSLQLDEDERIYSKAEELNGNITKVQIASHLTTNRTVCNGSSGDASSMDCHGLVWLVTPDEIVPLIEYLDYREKGGYFQTFIQVRLQQPTSFHQANDVVTALVYIGHSHNPNFFLPSRINRSLPLNTRRKTQLQSLFYYFASRSAVTDIISTAIGPSGPNLEYLFNLHTDLVKRKISDLYLENLVLAVRLRIGIWRRRYFYEKLLQHLENEESILTHERLSFLPITVYGFGSNEFHQLTPETPTSSVEIDSSVYSENCYYHPIDITSSTIIRKELSVQVNKVPWEEVEHFHLVAGSNSSALINSRENSITIWGRLPKLLLQKYSNDFTSSSDSNSVASITILNVKGAAIGYDHMILHLSNDSSRIVCLGENQYGQCNAPNFISVPSSKIRLIKVDTDQHIYKLHYETLSEPPEFEILKIATGLYHSAVITVCGGLITWGKEKFGAVLTDERNDNNSSIWYPPVDRNTGNPTKLIDVVCGLKHTIVLDDYGTIYSMGENRFGSLGRTVPLKEESLLSQSDESAKYESKKNALIDNQLERVALPDNVKFQRITSGWYHTVARGVHPDGSLVFYGWGRRDMHQYAIDEASATFEHDSDNLPKPLLSLPQGDTGRNIAEVWCGSEFTVVCDDNDGQLWSCGWNEHGNLGIGKHPNDHQNISVNDWQLVGRNKSRCAEVFLWEGSVACGGGHVLYLPK